MPESDLISASRPEAWQQMLHIFFQNHAHCRVSVQAVVAGGSQAWQVLVMGLEYHHEIPHLRALENTALEAGLLKWAASIHQKNWPLWGTVTFRPDGTIRHPDELNGVRWWPLTDNSTHA